MTKDDIDQMWNQAMNEAIKNGENFTRYRFAALVAEREREECAKLCESEWSTLEQMDAGGVFAAAIRARGEKA